MDIYTELTLRILLLFVVAKTYQMFKHLTVSIGFRLGLAEHSVQPKRERKRNERPGVGGRRD